MINRVFEKIIQITFPANATRNSILTRVAIVGMFLSILLVIISFGFAPLLSVIEFRFFDGDPPDFSLGAILAAMLLSIVLGILFKTSQSKNMAALVFINVLFLLYHIPSRCAAFIGRRKELFRNIAIFFAVGAIAALVKAYDVGKHTQKATNSYSKLVQDTIKFIELQPVSAVSGRSFQPLAIRFTEISQDPYLPSDASDLSCMRLFFTNLLHLYDLTEKPTKSFEIPQDFAYRLEITAKALGKLEGCSATPFSSFLQIWLSKAHLNLSQQGRLVDQTIKAHNLLIDAQEALQHKEISSGALENALGIVYSHYVVQYDVITSSYSWPDLTKPPSANHDNKHPPFVQIVNAAVTHFLEGKSLTYAEAESYATARLKNNLKDLMFQLLRLRDRDYVKKTGNFDPLGSVHSYVRDEVDHLRSRPLIWLDGAREELVSHLETPPVPEVLITIAQLGSSRLEVLSEIARAPTEPEAAEDVRRHVWLTPVTAVQSALVIGFRNRAFFEYPEFMGMCPLINSHAGSQYARVVAEFLPELTPEHTITECRG